MQFKSTQWTQLKFSLSQDCKKKAATFMMTMLAPVLLLCFHSPTLETVWQQEHLSHSRIFPLWPSLQFLIFCFSFIHWVNVQQGRFKGLVETLLWYQWKYIKNTCIGIILWEKARSWRKTKYGFSCMIGNKGYRRFGNRKNFIKEPLDQNAHGGWNTT